MLLWAAQDSLDPPAREVIAEGADTVFVSAVTIWEIEIKRAHGRLHAPPDVIALVDGSGFERLPISLEHAREAGSLPAVHKDPFDRMLVAQAHLERMTLATADARLGRYGVPVFAVAPS